MPTVLTFLGLLLPMTLSPGPAAIALTGLGMRRGIMKAMPFYCGLLISVFAIATASAFGLSTIILSNDTAYQTTRLASIAYVVYLGWKFLISKPTVMEAGASEYGFVDGMVLTVLNPKFYAIVAAIFSQFIGPDNTAIWTLIIGFTAVLAFSQLVWLTAGLALRPLLKSETALRIQSVVFGLLLIGVAIYLLVGGA